MHDKTATLIFARMANTATLTTRDLVEVSGFVPGVKVATPGILPGVKLLGLTSKNGRRYTKEALEKAHAEKLYEGATVYVDHPADERRPRGYRDRFGRVENVVVREGALFGDLHYNPKHILADQIVWDAENTTEGVGLSHNIKAGTRREKGGEVIEEIVRVKSVDLVDGPATTRTLYEQAETTLGEVLEKWIAEARDGETLISESKDAAHVARVALVRATIKEYGTDPVMGAGMAADVQQNPDEAIKSGIRTAVMAAFDDPSLDSKETIEKIQKLLAAQDAALGKTPPAEDAGQKVAGQLPPKVEGEGEGAQKPEGEEKPAPPEDEKKKFEQIQRRAEAMEVLATHKIVPRPELVKELCEQADGKAMRATVATWTPAKRGAERPAITTLFEGKRVDAYPKDHAGFASAIKRRR